MIGVTYADAAAEGDCAGGLAVGTLDILDAIIFWRIRAGAPAMRIFQSIAGGYFGRATFDGGIRTAVLGGVTLLPARWRRRAGGAGQAVEHAGSLLESRSAGTVEYGRGAGGADRCSPYRGCGECPSHVRNTSDVFLVGTSTPALPLRRRLMRPQLNAARSEPVR